MSDAKPRLKKLGDPNRAKVVGFRKTTTEALRAARFEGKTPEGQAERAVSYDPAAVRAAIEAQTCPLCGAGPYKVIAVHTNKAHGIDKWELRNMAGLTTQDSICAPEVSEGARERAVERKLHEYGAVTRKNGRRPQRWTEAGRAKNRNTIATVNERLTSKERLTAAAKASETKRAKPTCSHGHEWTVANTRMNSDGSRGCRACEKDRSRVRSGFAGTHEVVDATGTLRRLQALAAIGYPVHVTVQRLGLSTWWAGNIMKRGREGSGVVRTTADAVTALYDELCDAPAPESKGSKITRTVAAAKGWLPPSSWPPGTLDDPHSTPTAPADPGGE